LPDGRIIIFKHDTGYESPLAIEVNGENLWDIKPGKETKKFWMVGQSYLILIIVDVILPDRKKIFISKILR